MCGSETLEMLVSSNSMKVAIVTVSAIAHRLRAGSALGAAEASALNAVRAGAIAAIRSAPLTFPDATGDSGPARDRTEFEPGAAAPLSRNSRSRSRQAVGLADRRSRRACGPRNLGKHGRRCRCES